MGTKPSADQLEDLIDSVHQTDYMARPFFYLIPYILDFIEQDHDSLIEVVPLFCHSLLVAQDDEYPNGVSVAGYRADIGRVLLASMERIGSSDSASLEQYCSVLAGISAAFGSPDLGIEIVRLADRN
jgi:hypothetical protein